jgi:hypothetical protein
MVARNAKPLPLEAFQMQQMLATGPLLLGYDLYKLGHASDPETPLYSGDPLHINLYWQKPAGSDFASASLVDFRLLDAQGKMVATWQNPVAGIDYPMMDWIAGEILRGQFDFFLSEVPPGHYQLEVQLNNEVVGTTRPFQVEGR